MYIPVVVELAENVVRVLHISLRCCSTTFPCLSLLHPIAFLICYHHAKWVLAV